MDFPTQAIETMKTLSMIALCSAALLCNLAHANGPSDLKAALGRLRGQTPMKASVEVTTWRRTGEGKSAEESAGHASVGVDDNPQGLKIEYDRDFLARLEAEAEAVARNPNAKSSATNAARELNFSDLLPMVSASPSLAHNVERAVFSGEKIDSYKGKPARLLSYTPPITTLKERERKYIKDFDTTLSIWIDADGTPLASRLRQLASGRAFVVVRFESSYEEQQVYEVHGDRLCITRLESKSTSSGAGEKDENSVVKTLRARS
jgi:hypothetical protein